MINLGAYQTRASFEAGLRFGQQAMSDAHLQLLQLTRRDGVCEGRIQGILIGTALTLAFCSVVASLTQIVPMTTWQRLICY